MTVTSIGIRLSGATIEALQLQKNWLRRGVVQSELTKLPTSSKHLPWEPYRGISYTYFVAVPES
jgi:hypothetical protein